MKITQQGVTGLKSAYTEILHHRDRPTFERRWMFRPNLLLDQAKELELKPRPRTVQTNRPRLDDQLETTIVCKSYDRSHTVGLPGSFKLKPLTIKDHTPNTGFLLSIPNSRYDRVGTPRSKPKRVPLKPKLFFGDGGSNQLPKERYWHRSQTFSGSDYHLLKKKEQGSNWVFNPNGLPQVLGLSVVRSTPFALRRPYTS